MPERLSTGIDGLDVVIEGRHLPSGVISLGGHLAMACEMSALYAAW